MSRRLIYGVFVAITVPCVWLISVVWLMAAVTIMETLPNIRSPRDFVSLYMGLGAAIVTTLGFGLALCGLWLTRPKP